jgi:hypothetical protein
MGDSMNKEDRYFFKVDNEDKPVFLFRMKEGFLAQEWFEGRWQHSDRLLDLMDKGFVDIDPCSEVAAREFKPEAFENQ